MGISRRSVLGGIGQAATLGALATALPPQLRAAQAAAPAPAPAAPAAAPAPAAPAPTYCLVSLYGSENGATFNGDMFRDQHLPLLKNAYGPSAERIELRLAPPPAEGAQQQPPHRGSEHLVQGRAGFHQAQWRCLQGHHGQHGQHHQGRLHRGRLIRWSRPWVTTGWWCRSIPSACRATFLRRKARLRRQVFLGNLLSEARRAVWRLRLSHRTVQRCCRLCRRQGRSAEFGAHLRPR